MCVCDKAHLSGGVIHLGSEQSEVSASSDVHQILDCLCVFLSTGGVPEDETVVGFFRLSEGVHHRVREISPLCVCVRVHPCVCVLNIV